MVAIMWRYLLSILALCSCTYATPFSREEWLTWARHDGSNTYTEMALVNDEEQTILMVSGEAFKIGNDDSVSLHDFKMGLVALKSFSTNECFVSHVRIATYQEAKDRLEARQGHIYARAPLENAVARPLVLTEAQVGGRIVAFCRDAPAYWFSATDIPDSPAKRDIPINFLPPLPDDKRDVAIEDLPPLPTSWKPSTRPISCLVRDTHFIKEYKHQPKPDALDVTTAAVADDIIEEEEPDALDVTTAALADDSIEEEGQ